MGDALTALGDLLTPAGLAKTIGKFVAGKIPGAIAKHSRNAALKATRSENNECIHILIQPQFQFGDLQFWGLEGAEDVNIKAGTLFSCRGFLHGVYPLHTGLCLCLRLSHWERSPRRAANPRNLRQRDKPLLHYHPDPTFTPNSNVELLARSRWDKEAGVDAQNNVYAIRNASEIGYPGFFWRGIAGDRGGGSTSIGYCSICNLSKSW